MLMKLSTKVDRYLSAGTEAAICKWLMSQGHANTTNSKVQPFAGYESDGSVTQGCLCIGSRSFGFVIHSKGRKSVSKVAEAAV
jgi:hypothetical protein